MSGGTPNQSEAVLLVNPPGEGGTIIDDLLDTFLLPITLIPQTFRYRT